MSSTSRVDVVPSGLWVHRGRAPEMTSAHRHDDVEVNVVLDGAIEYLFGGRRITVRAGQAAVFWASVPHRLLDVAGMPAQVCWVHLPLGEALSWDLPSATLAPLLQGELVLTPAPAGAASTWAVWADDLAHDDAVTTLLEVQAMVRRIMRLSRIDPGGPHATGRPFRMAAHLMERFHERVTAADAAAAVHLNTEYAMTLFRRTWGMTVGEFLARRRVAEAQRLLATTGLSTATIAHSAGFGSVSSFYAQFGRFAGTSPGDYRSSLRR